ncbi:MAG TPA: V-type ATP synthase subunit D [Rhabdochlamydiaceae bacterium]
MADVKLTKTELRLHQLKLGRLQKYLPTLQLKKSLLQMEVIQAQAEIDLLKEEFSVAEEKVAKFSALLTDRRVADIFSATNIQHVDTLHENIAGVDIPLFKDIIFETAAYSLFDSPFWFESAIARIKELIVVREKIRIVEEKKQALEKELRDVSIRVNLFEKILIPRAVESIKKIKIFLGDQQLAAVCQSKVAKNKILQRNKEKKR